MRHASPSVALALVTAFGCASSPTPPPQGEAPAPAPAPAPSPAPTPAPAPARVCCESFGYGARMVECCQRVEWTAADQCRTPEGLVGGGRRVVADARCETSGAARPAP